MRYGMVNRGNCKEYGRSWMQGLAAHQSRMRRAADALEGCVGVLSPRARQCVNEQEHNTALQIPVPGGDGDELAMPSRH
eukprot:7590670-Lingulodinium_polyedra.AAC.1